jgi:hypothetical protein
METDRTRGITEVRCWSARRFHAVGDDIFHMERYGKLPDFFSPRSVLRVGEN